MTTLSPVTASLVAPVIRRAARVPSVKERLLLRGATALSNWFGSRGTDCFGILMYHRVTEHGPGSPQPTWNVTPETFREQLAGLLTRGFEPWPLRAALDQHRRGLTVPRRAFVVTFDDGYECVYRRAWPILRDLEIPATIFLSTAYLDGNEPFPCDDWISAGDGSVATDSWRPLRTEQCREMQESGLIELAAHTHTHADFRGREEALREDLEENIRQLRERFGMDDATFAFPFGVVRQGFACPALSNVAKKAGMLCALSTEQELIRKSASPFQWGRFPAEQHDTAATLAAKLNGWTSALRGITHAALHFFGR